jgi:hypothetical protein
MELENAKSPEMIECERKAELTCLELCIGLCIGIICTPSQDRWKDVEAPCTLHAQNILSWSASTLNDQCERYQPSGT